VIAIATLYKMRLLGDIGNIKRHQKRIEENVGFIKPKMALTL
jgi:hypothetical protein